MRLGDPPLPIDDAPSRTLPRLLHCFHKLVHETHSVGEHSGSDPFVVAVQTTLHLGSFDSKWIDSICHNSQLPVPWQVRTAGNEWRRDDCTRIPGLCNLLNRAIQLRVCRTAKARFHRKYASPLCCSAALHGSPEFGHKVVWRRSRQKSNIQFCRRLRWNDISLARTFENCYLSGVAQVRTKSDLAESKPSLARSRAPAGRPTAMRAVRPSTSTRYLESIAQPFG